MALAGFPVTRPSVIEDLSAPDPEARRAAQDLLARAYWAPIASTLRVRWSMDDADAEDLTQEFLSEALQKEWLSRYDPAKARFRTFLRMCVDRFAAKARQANHRLKRGGGAEVVALDENLAANEARADDHFRQEWVRSVFTMALDGLRAEAAATGKEVNVAVFEAHDIDDAQPGRPSYRQLAARFNLPETTITNHLAWARRSFRRHVLAVLRRLAGSESEFRQDARELLGLDVT